MSLTVRSLDGSAARVLQQLRPKVTAPFNAVHFSRFTSNQCKPEPLRHFQYRSVRKLHIIAPHNHQKKKGSYMKAIALSIAGVSMIGLMQAKKKVGESESSIIFYDAIEHLGPGQVGGKAANLQKLQQVPGVITPAWFVLPTDFFMQYLLENNILDLVDKLQEKCSINAELNWEEIEALSAQIKAAIANGTLNESQRQTMNASFIELSRQIGTSNPRFAVRSSGVMEDAAESSCAGLYDTILNCKTPFQVEDAIKSVWASSFNLRVIQERVRLGVKQTSCLMGVIVQELIDAKASGVASTIVLSNNFPGIQIAANYGLGESVVGGEVSVDGWILHPTKGYILERIKGSKDFSFITDNDGGIKKHIVSSADRNQFVLTTEEVLFLGKQVSDIKKLYGCEVDVEFAFDEHRKLFILQTRPLISVSAEKMMIVDPEDAKKHKMLAKGLYSVPGVASGRLVFVSSWADLSGKIKLSSDDIVLAYVTTNTWSQYLVNIRGLITKEGSPSSHPILLSREKKVPCVIGIDDTFEKLLSSNGAIVTIDGLNKVIYEGVVARKEASAQDLAQQFAPIQLRKWPNTIESLPHLLHNKMVVAHEGKYWRRTPTYPVTGFQQELNMLRFALVPMLIGQNGFSKISAKVIDGYTCNELVPFEEYVSLFKSMTINEAFSFHEAQSMCMKEFMRLSQEFTLESSHWHRYIETYARFRAYIWLGGGMRSYAERKVDKMGLALELPTFYLDESAHVLQADMDEIDVQMSQDIYECATLLRDQEMPPTIQELKVKNTALFDVLLNLSHKYRFEHAISLDKETDLNFVYKRVLQEVTSIRSGAVFATSKKEHQNREVLPDAPELRDWLKLSIWNRILQSDSHHLDARAKVLVRPKLLELGNLLVQKRMLAHSEQIFDCSVDQIARYIELVK